jgi:hypothetical protein
LKIWLDDPEFAGYVVLDKTGRVLSSNEDSLVGLQPVTGYVEFTKEVLSSGSLVTPPFLSTAILTDEWGNQTAGVPTMFAAAPVKESPAPPVPDSSCTGTEGSGWRATDGGSRRPGREI